MNILNEVSKASTIVIRIKKGGNNKVLDKRGYATTKVHSDAWNGQTLDSIFMLMLLGDIKNNNVQFFKPIIFKKDILKKLKDFDSGSNYYKKLKNLGYINKNHLAIFDQLCLHRSYLKSKKSRVSIDFAVDLNKNIRKDFFQRRARRYKYYPLKEWLKLDYGKMNPRNSPKNAL